MDALVDRLTEEFRRSVWDVVTQAPVGDEALQAEAQHIYDNLKRRAWGDLRRDPHAALFVALMDARSRRHGRRWMTIARNAGWWAAIAGGAHVSAADQASRRRIIESVRQRFRELPAPCRATLVLHRIEGLSLEQIAERLSLPVTAVRRQLARGLRHCASARRSHPV